ncbi:MAG: hypothetical protein AB7S38_41180 [Vulcanimicrobiota bacterium]
MQWLHRLLGAVPRQDYLEATRQLGELRLETQDLAAKVSGLEAEVGRLAQAGPRQAESARRELLQAMGPALCQLALQSALVEGGQFTAADVLTVVRRIFSTLEAQGLVWVGEVGQEVAFDLNRHRPLAALELATGSPVRVRVPGLAFGEEVLVAAGVEPI